jgi:hypothetical protein
MERSSIIHESKRGEPTTENWESKLRRNLIRQRGTKPGTRGDRVRSIRAGESDGESARLIEQVLEKSQMIWQSIRKQREANYHWLGVFGEGRGLH